MGGMSESERESERKQRDRGKSPYTGREREKISSLSIISSFDQKREKSTRSVANCDDDGIFQRLILFASYFGTWKILPKFPKTRILLPLSTKAYYISGFLTFQYKI